jgi:hypothetical protein
MRVSLRSLSLVALIGTAASVPALAQPNPGDAPALSQYGACASKPSPSDTEAAHGAYMAGKGSFDEADYTTAINYFKDAYRRDCTKNELLIIIARAYELQGNRREAVHALETYLERVPTAQDAEVQRRHIANLKREITEQPAPVVSASAPPSVSASAAPSVSPTAPSASASVAPPPSASSSAPPTDRAGHTVPPWVVVGVGGAALVTGAILYGVGAGQVSTAEQTCPVHGTCPSASAVSTGNSGRTNETVGVVVGAVGLGAVALGLVWHFVEGTRADATPTPATARPLLTPQLGPGYAGVGLTGRF